MLIREPVLHPVRVFHSGKGEYHSFLFTGYEVSANSLSLHCHFVYMKRLYRSRKEQMLGGICGGLAEYIEVDPSIIRLVLIVLIVLSWGLFILVYIAAWIIVPASPEESTSRTTSTEGEGQ